MIVSSSKCYDTGFLSVKFVPGAVTDHRQHGIIVVYLLVLFMGIAYPDNVKLRVGLRHLAIYT